MKESLHSGLGGRVTALHEKRFAISRFARIVLVLAGLTAPGPLFAEGNLEPSAAPGPTMKTLQELYDVSDSLLLRVDSLQYQLYTFQASIDALLQQNRQLTFLLYLLGDGTEATLPWQITTVDDLGDYDDEVGKDCSLAFTPIGYPAIAYSYYDRHDGSPTTMGVRYATFDGANWLTTTVTNRVSDAFPAVSGLGEEASLAFGPDGHPVISYLVIGPTSHDYMLNVAIFNGTNWMMTTVNPSNQKAVDTSLALTPGGQPSVCYRDESPPGIDAHLMYAVFNGSTWMVSTVDTNSGIDPSLAYNAAGQPAISYLSSVTLGEGRLQYTEYNGTEWITTTVDHNPSALLTGYSSSLAFTAEGRPVISYITGGVGGGLKYAVFNGSTWSISTVDRHGTSSPTSLAFSPTGRTAISYTYGTLTDRSELRYAVYNGVVWSIATIYRFGSTVGNIDSSLAFTPDGQPAIAYYDGDHRSLNYAVRAPPAAP